RVERGHAHRAVDARLHRGDLGLRLLPRLEQPAAGLVERLALGGHDERALGAIEEGHAQLGLELLHRLARRRLGYDVLGGATGKRPMPDHVAVEAEGLQVHGQIIRLTNTYHLTFWG